MTLEKGEKYAYERNHNCINYSGYVVSCLQHNFYHRSRTLWDVAMQPETETKLIAISMDGMRTHWHRITCKELQREAWRLGNMGAAIGIKEACFGIPIPGEFKA